MNQKHSCLNVSQFEFSTPSKKFETETLIAIEEHKKVGVNPQKGRRGSGEQLSLEKLPTNSIKLKTMKPRLVYRLLFQQCLQ